MSDDIYVSLEFTPNPNTLKYSVNRTLVERGGAYFKDAESAAKGSPLAAVLFETHGICGVMLGKDFVTITKTLDGDWDVVHKEAAEKIEAHLRAGEPVLLGDLVDAHDSKGETEVEKKIIEFLDREIRPAVAMDGGDITFEKFENGVAYVFLQGACAGCPSSTATLKQGIEARLSEEVPEVKEVVAI